MKIYSNLLLIIAQNLVDEAVSDPYGPEMRDWKSDKLMADQVNENWVERFMFVKCIIVRVQTGELSPSAEKGGIFEREVGFNFGVLMRGFIQKRWMRAVCLTPMTLTFLSIFIADICSR